MRTPRDHAKEVKRCLLDPVALCSRLGLMKGSHRQSRGVIIRCPRHGEKNASCGVRTGKDGTIQVKCFSCGFGQDALALIAIVYGLSTNTDFQEVLAIGAEISGNLGLADEIRGDTVKVDRPKMKPPALRKYKEREYLSTDSIVDVFRRSVRCSNDSQVSAYLMSRAIYPPQVDKRGLARVIRQGEKMPWWASRKGGRDAAISWSDSGHRLIVPAWDYMGRLKGLRAWRVCAGDSPTRLPPAGARGTGLVVANKQATVMLQGNLCPHTLWITEGEPDMLTVACREWLMSDAVIGIGSGSWSSDFAKRIPAQTAVIICTHGDNAGDKYADDIKETLDRPLLRWRPVPDINAQAMAGTLSSRSSLSIVSF